MFKINSFNFPFNFCDLQANVFIYFQAQSNLVNADFDNLRNFVIKELGD